MDFEEFKEKFVEDVKQGLYERGGEDVNAEKQEVMRCLQRIIRKKKRSKFLSEERVCLLIILKTVLMSALMVMTELSVSLAIRKSWKSITQPRTEQLRESKA